MKSGFAPIHNGQLYFESRGSGEALVFIHGNTLDHRMWKSQVDFFSKQYQVITFDMRGFGKSSMPDSSYSYHDDLFQLLKHLHVSLATIIGMSLGGVMATNFVLTHPEMSTRLILVDAGLGGYRSTVDWRVYAETVGLAEAKKRWQSHEVFHTTQLSAEVKSSMAEMLADYSGWFWLNHDPVISLSPPAVNRLNEIMCPTLIITGEKDLEYFQTIAEKYNQGIVGSKKTSIPEAGHMVNMEKPEQFNKVVEQFIKSSS